MIKELGKTSSSMEFGMTDFIAARTELLGVLVLHDVCNMAWVSADICRSPLSICSTGISSNECSASDSPNIASTADGTNGRVSIAGAW